ncbi:MAG: hypothetical protein K0S34_1640 [Bacillales bacterium]|jgi:hypothetical protein|nr:hypothetical protein [Bacillales bacterium]
MDKNHKGGDFMLLPLRLDLNRNYNQISRRSINTSFPIPLVSKVQLKEKFMHQQRNDLEIITNQFLMKDKKYVASQQTTEFYDKNKKLVLYPMSKIDLKI